VVLNQSLFYNMTSGLDLEVKWLLKIKEFGSLYTMYGP